MELIDSLHALAKTYREIGSNILTEEATKTGLIMPFMQALGYNVFNPSEVVPEYNAELPGTKKGDKVDYIIQIDKQPVMLIECKWCGAELDISQESQLMRYFHALSARIAILTNGVKYRFYSDLDERNKMDSKPFFQFDITILNESISRELKKFTRTAFNLEQIMPVAEELKYTGEMKKYLLDQLNEPEELFVRHLAKQVYEGMLTKPVLEKFKEITKKAFSQFVSERVSDRLTSALQEEKDSQGTPKTEDVSEDEKKVVTTQEELDAYFIVKAILRQKVPASRIAFRDAQTYSSVFLDDTNRKPICRFYFNSTNKCLGVFDAVKNESRIPIQTLDDIYSHADTLLKTLSVYETTPLKEETPSTPA